MTTTPLTPDDIDVEHLHGRRNTHRAMRMAVADMLERLTWSRPDQEAIVARPGAFASERFQRLTYREADRLANQVAHALLRAGLQRSDRVAMVCENSVEAVIAMFGIAKAGMVCAPINPLFHASVTQELLVRVGARFAIVDAELYPSCEPAFAAVGFVPQVSIPINGSPPESSRSFEEWIEGSPTEEPELETRLHADDVWMMSFTSGTTSSPKAVMCSNAYTYFASFAFRGSVTRGLRHEEDLRLATFLPIIYHCGHNAAIFPAFLAGGTAILGRRFDPLAVAAAVSEEAATALWAGAPRFLEAVAGAAESRPDLDLTSLTVGLFSWTAMAPSLMERLLALCGPQLQLVEAFGQTEAISCYRFWLDRNLEKVQSSDGEVNHVGVPNPLLAAAIVDDAGNQLHGSAGVPGEVVYRSPAMTSGYYREPEATAFAFRDGWFHSGDCCVYEDDGSQTMVDRYKDIIKSGGENVSSLRVEMVAGSHPGVARVAVVGLPDERWGERVTLAVLRNEGASVTEEDLIAYCRNRLAGFEAPKSVVFLDAFPETVGGKILKYRLRQDLDTASRAATGPEAEASPEA